MNTLSEQSYTLQTEILFLTGGPGAGKSHGKKLSQYAQQSGLDEKGTYIKHISTGELLRSFSQTDDPELFARIQQAMNDQNNDSTVLNDIDMGQIFSRWVETFGSRKIFQKQHPSIRKIIIVVDGWPRSRHQTETVHHYVEKLNAKLLGICMLEVSEPELQKRLTQRAVENQQTGNIRPDDLPERQMQRLNEWRMLEREICSVVQTEDLPFVSVNGEGEKHHTQANITKLIRDYQSQVGDFVHLNTSK